jgi:serine/threonine protein kinase
MGDPRIELVGPNPDETIDDRPGLRAEASGLFDRLMEEVVERCRRDVVPSVAEYETRHPQHAERIRKLFPTVAMMEQLKHTTERGRAGEPSRSLPQSLGEFRILRELGRGGMGVVYEAVQESLGRHVALKVVHQASLDSRRIKRFQREAQAIAQLHHTNIVPILAVGEHDGLPHYAM